MSESKVPQIDRLPDGLAGWVCRYQVLTPHGWIGAWDKEAIEWYGDARAAEARRLALLEAADIAANSLAIGRPPLLILDQRLRALADNAKLSGPNGPQERQR